MSEERTDMDVKRDVVKTYLHALACTRLPQLPDPEHIDGLVNALEELIELKIKESKND